MRRALTIAGAAALALALTTPVSAYAAARPVNTKLPRISGRAIAGRVLTASHGSWTHRPSSFTYRWQRCTKAGACSTVAHRSRRRYKLSRSDVGHRIRVVVTARNGLRSKPARSRLTRIVTNPPPPPVTPATAYQLNAQHTGFSAHGFSTTARKLWFDNLGASVSYPLIVGNQVFVIAGDNSYPDPELIALNASTGKVEWGPVQLGGTYPWAGLTFDGGRVFTVNGSGTMEAFDAGTGALDWAAQLPGQTSFSSASTASDGLVYTGGAGSGGTLYAVNESTGSLVWSRSVQNGDQSSPAVSSSGVYVSYACAQTYDFAPATGSLNWWHDTACEGGGGKTPVLANGRVYVRDSSFPAILSAGDGSLLSSFRSQGPVPAVSSSMIFNLQNGALSGASATPPSSIKWTFSGDGTLSTAPLVAGSSVIVGGTSGEVYAVAASTGKLVWKANAGASIPAPDEQNVSQPLTGLAESGGLLVVPAGDTLTAFR